MENKMLLIEKKRQESIAQNKPVIFCSEDIPNIKSDVVEIAKKLENLGIKDLFVYDFKSYLMTSKEDVMDDYGFAEKEAQEASKYINYLKFYGYIACRLRTCDELELGSSTLDVYIGKYKDELHLEQLNRLVSSEKILSVIHKDEHLKIKRDWNRIVEQLRMWGFKNNLPEKEYYKILNMTEEKIEEKYGMLKENVDRFKKYIFLIIAILHILESWEENGFASYATYDVDSESQKDKWIDNMCPI